MNWDKVSTMVGIVFVVAAILWAGLGCEKTDFDNATTAHQFAGEYAEGLKFRKAEHRVTICHADEEGNAIIKDRTVDPEVKIDWSSWVDRS